MTSQITPLAGISPHPMGDTPQIGELVTVLLRKGDDFIQCGARLERVRAQTAFIKLAGLEVPQPYELGQRLPIPIDKVVDWD